jgi:hypothetical protein
VDIDNFVGEKINNGKVFFGNLNPLKSYQKLAILIV